MVRLVIADSRQLFLLEPHLDEIEYDTRSTIYQHWVANCGGEEGGDVLVLSVVSEEEDDDVGCDPGQTMLTILSTTLSDMSFRKQQECMLVVDSVATGAVS